MTIETTFNPTDRQHQFQSEMVGQDVLAKHRSRSRAETSIIRQTRT